MSFTKDTERLLLRQALLVHYNHICMGYYDNQTEGAVAEMQQWCQMLWHYLNLSPLSQNLKRSAEALKISLCRLANPAFWKESEWVSLISILGEAYAEHLIKEEAEALLF